MDALMASYGMVINPEKNSTWGPLFRSDFRGGRASPGATVRYFSGYTSGQVRIVGVEEDTDPREFDKYERDIFGPQPNPDTINPLVGVWLWRTP